MRSRRWRACPAACWFPAATGSLPDGVIAAPPGASGLLAWLATYGQLADGAAGIPGLVTVVGDFAATPYRPQSPRGRRCCCPDSRHLRRGNSAHGGGGRRTAAHHKLTQELAAAQAEERRQTLSAQRDMLRTEAAAAAEQLAPLNDAFELTDAAHRDACADQRTLDRRRAEVSAHLAACHEQLADQERRLRDLAVAADRALVTAWIGHLDTCGPEPQASLAARAAEHSPLDLPAEFTAHCPGTGAQVLATLPAGSHREILHGWKPTLVLPRRSQPHAASRPAPSLTEGTSTRSPMPPWWYYHEQAAAVDRRRTRDSEEREVTALATAIDRPAGRR